MPAMGPSTHGETPLIKVRMYRYRIFQLTRTLFELTITIMSINTAMTGICMVMTIEHWSLMGSRGRSCTLEWR